MDLFRKKHTSVPPQQQQQHQHQHQQPQYQQQQYQQPPPNQGQYNQQYAYQGQSQGQGHVSNGHSSHGSYGGHGSVNYGHPGHQQSVPPPPPRNRGPPPGADPRLWQFFSNVDADHSGSIDVHELQRALVNSNWSNFDLDTVKMLMNIFDTDRSGTIGFNEFAGLYKYIEDWQNVFRHWDVDGSGSIEEGELAGALKGFGYELSPQLIHLIVKKYSSAPAAGYGGPPPSITFDRFLRACVAIKDLTDAFKSADRDNDGWIQVSYEQFMGLFLRAP